MLNGSDRRKREQAGPFRISKSWSGRVWLAVGVAAFLSFCLASNLQPPRFTLRVGQTVPHDIRAPFTVAYLDASAHRLRDSPRPVMSLVQDPEARLAALEDLSAAVRHIHEARAASPTISPASPTVSPASPTVSPASKPTPSAVSSGAGHGSAGSGAPTPSDTGLVRLREAIPTAPPALLASLLHEPAARYNAAVGIASAVLALEMAQRPITANAGDLDLARQDLRSRARQFSGGAASGTGAAPGTAAVSGSDPSDQAAELAGIFLRPSVVEKPAAAPASSGRSAGRAGSPLYVLIRQNELLAHRGDIATARLVEELDALGLNGASVGFLWRLCLVALSVGSLLMVIIYIRLYDPDLYADTRRLALLAFIVLSGVAALRFLGYALGLHFTESQYGFFALMWVAAAAMLIATLIGVEVAVLTSALLSLYTAILLDSQLQFGVAVLFSALAAIYTVHRMRQRAHVLRASAILAGVNLVSVWVVTIWNAGPIATHLRLDLRIATEWALIAGILSPFLFYIGVAVLERLFGITTDLTLLELCDSDQPLLRRLVLEAPGTYAHSLGVASLAEAAAEAIGAESLWVRAGAMYHDVGKIVRPYFFIENQQGENLHNKLSPTMSAKVITAHIPDGVELAEEHRLPPLLIDFIRQHHGTSLVTYFYHQAIITSDTPSGISEMAFRYPGPKPQTREAGILMLADIVESSFRAAQRKNPGRTDAMIARVVQRCLGDGQLSECDLTLREIDQIQAAFTRILGAIHHSRIEYPATEVAEERALAGAGSGR